MAEVPKDLRFLLFGRGAKWHAKVSMVLTFIALASLIVGIIGDVTNTVPGLEPSNWFLITIAFLLVSMYAWICAYAAAKEG